MKRLLTAILLCFSIVCSFAQAKFKTEYFANNIIKITLVTDQQWHNENVSDAVILKPLKIVKEPITLHLNEGSVLLDKRIDVSVFDSANYRGFLLPLANDEMIFGGGERALPLNRRGYRLNLYNNPWYGYSEGADNLNYSVPFITSSKGYGLFFDNPSKSFLDIGKKNNDVLEYGSSSGEINVYVIFGNYQQILQSYYKLTGTQPLPPRWALGNLMSRFGYTSEQQAKDILQKMKHESIPVDAIIFDLFWFGDSIQRTLGNLDWVNKKAWPDPKKMIGNFRKDGINTILVTEPFFVETANNYSASRKYAAVDSFGKPYYLTDFYFGRGGLVDIFRNDSKQWFWQFYKKQMQNGVEAWWGDLGEPEKHPSNLYHNLKDYGYKRLFSADEVHNIYGHNWTKMLYDYYAKEYPNKRLFSLNRSGFAGTQRFSIFPWTGDVSRSWSGLRAQLPILLGMSMSGVPYVHSDAGGFAGGEGDNELYVRWLQFAAFTPIFRPHGTALYEKDPNAFSFPSEPALIDEPFRDYAKQVVNLRYAMLPYNYSLAYEQAKYGKPLIAPLYYYYSKDTNAIKIQDEYMWGENILVAPVLEKGSNTRTYYLPTGKWYNPINKKNLTGNSWYTDSVSIETLLAFVKEGGFVATGKLGKNTGEINGEYLYVLYNTSNFPSSYELYFDDGKTKNAIEKNAYELIKINSSGVKNSHLTLTIQSNKGSFVNKPLNRKISFIIPNQESSPKKILINGKTVKKETGGMFELGKTSWVDTDKETTVTINFTGNPVSIEFLW